ncbi:ABC transporter ATP-binding protein [Kineococcus sp. SYSU DK004]|uniref:ABC transporter ATP-binding protein n=1 Tax=Kineococcus sp. SYSU DK004 TaxID=3383125 RepID=UPI003D7EB7C2
MITFEAVRKEFGDGTVAVEHLDLELPAGQITVFVGPSGCGKTTSLRMINRMVEPTSGRVLLDGRDVAAQDPATLRRGIGYVIQHAGLFPHRTVADNIATVPRLSGRSRREARAAAGALLERVGLDAALGDRYPAQLSGGQQQRVGVARALAADPPVMLMDEPFSAVDPVVREQLQREFLRLQAELGKTIALVTHDIDEAVVLGDRIAVFRQGGHLAQFGTPRELLERPADDFVREFVGRDRGFRGLSFTGAGDLPVRPVAERVRGAALVLDAAGRPTGWETADGTVPTAGTFTAADSLRTVADLALLSPVGVAVRVDAAGRADGLVAHHDLVDHLDARRARAAGERV